MKIKAIGFVAVPVTNIKHAREFYEDVLGLTVSEEMMGGKWIEYAVGNNTLAIANVGEQWTPSDQGTGTALEVEDFEEAIKHLKDQHVRFAAEPFETPCCHMAVVQDPDGNKLKIHKLKPEKRERNLQMITNEVAFIAIAVSDKEGARKFYQETLELKPTSSAMEGAWVEYDLGAVTIGVGCHPAWKPSHDGTTIAFEVEDIDTAIAQLKERGVAFDMEKTDTP